MIRAWCLRWGSQVSDADDLAQEVLAKLVTAIPTFRYDPDRSFLRLAQDRHAECLDRFRQDPAPAGSCRPRPHPGDRRFLRRAGRPGKADEEALDRELFELAMHRVKKRVKLDDLAGISTHCDRQSSRARGGPGAGHAGRPRLRRQAPGAENARAGGAGLATNHEIHAMNHETHEKDAIRQNYCRAARRSYTNPES